MNGLKKSIDSSLKTECGCANTYKYRFTFGLT